MEIKGEVHQVTSLSERVSEFVLYSKAGAFICRGPFRHIPAGIVTVNGEFCTKFFGDKQFTYFRVKEVNVEYFSI